MISQTLKEDIGNIISDTNIPWEKMKNSTIFITGATGLIGNSLVHTLSAASDKYGLNLRILAHGRNDVKGKLLSKAYGVEFISGDIRKPLLVSLITDKVDYIFHCAAITKSADMVAKPVDVIVTAIDGTRNILEFARAMRSKSVVYLSSMEVYGQVGCDEVSEPDLGYLDLSNPRSSYPESKRLCENLCNCYFAQYGIPVKTARLARTFGAGVPNDDSDMRVAMQFARKAILKENIVLHTSGASIANCCYTADAVSGLLILLLKGENGGSYNISNPDASITIREMAELVARDICESKISVIMEVPVAIANCGYAPDVTMKLNSDKIAQLGWKPRYGIVEMYKRMLSDWAECGGQSKG